MDGGEELPSSRDPRRLLVAEKAHPAVARRKLVVLREVMPLGHVAAIERDLETRLRVLQALLGVALLGDVAAYAAIADETPRFIVARLPGDDVHLPRVARIGACDLEIEERQLPAQALEVRLERARIDLDARDLPEAPAIGGGVAEEGRHRPAAGEPGDAVLGVGLPEPVGGDLDQALQALLVRARGGKLALAPAGEEHHDEVRDARRDAGKQQGVADDVQTLLSRTGGATLSTSSMVVTPAPTFIAPLILRGFMPSLNACSRRAERSTLSFIRLLIEPVKSSVS